MLTPVSMQLLIPWSHVGLLVITTINTTHLSLRHPATSRNRLVFSASISSMKVSNRWKNFFRSLQVSSYYHSSNLPYICIVWLNRNGSHLVIFWSITIDFGASSSFTILYPHRFRLALPPTFVPRRWSCLRPKDQGVRWVLLDFAQDQPVKSGKYTIWNLTWNLKTSFCKKGKSFGNFPWFSGILNFGGV